jgi:hypothetical protein
MNRFREEGGIHLQALVFKLSEVYEYTSRCGGCRIYHRLILLALRHLNLLVSLCFLHIPE